jgi:hypothetical protein
MEVHASNDGTTFHKIGRCAPKNNGWQTRVSRLTHTVRSTSARYFRLVNTPRHPIGCNDGGDFKNLIEPLRFASIVLSSTPTVHLARTVLGSSKRGKAPARDVQSGSQKVAPSRQAGAWPEEGIAKVPAITRRFR